MADQDAAVKPFALPYTHKLSQPVTVGQETVEEIVFTRKPIGKDFIGLPVDLTTWKFDENFQFLCRLCGKSMAVMHGLASEDVIELSGLAAVFTLGGLLTGSSASR